jgi:diguanylate cyclase (GGDEF)-like protein/PAS domain S-box-containing protein
LLVLVLAGVVISASWLSQRHQSALHKADLHSETAMFLQETAYHATVADLLIERYVSTGADPLLPVIDAELIGARDSLSMARSKETELEPGSVPSEDLARIDQTATDIATFAAQANVITGLRQRGDSSGARAALEAASPPIGLLGQRFAPLLEKENAETAAFRHRAASAGSLSFWLLIASGATATIATCALSIVLARSIVRPLSILESTARAVARGDLDAHAPVTGPREVANVATALNVMTESLSDALRRERASLIKARESEQWLRFAQGAAGVGTFSWDIGGDTTTCSDEYFRLFGIEPRATAVTTAEWREHLHPEDRERVIQAMSCSVFDGAPFRAEYRLVWSDGSEHWVSSRGEVFRDDAGQPVRMMGALIDITDRKRAEEKTEYLAYHDALTGLANRELVKDRLAAALEQARSDDQLVAVLLLDLDRFKLVNDAAGRQEADELLRTVGAALCALVGAEDTVARLGTDEFILLLPARDYPDQVIDVAERIIESFRQPHLLANHEFHITATIGMAIFPYDADDPEALLSNADVAMYQAKEHGRNRYERYRSEMNASILPRLALENDLRNGLARGEFVVYYQPQVDVVSGRTVGVEALVRWQHPERGLVMPADFIYMAEETGLILPLGEWVLRVACAQAKAWHNAGHPNLRMAVNLSSRQFLQRDLVERVQSALRESGLAAEYLELEITESAAIQDVRYTAMILAELRQLGVRIAIDDFGTGYSSLDRLRRLTVNTVKIDQTFICNLVRNQKDANIVNTMIEMAHSLGLGVVAEGVATEEQLDFLRERSCEQVQGYLFSKALPAEEASEALFHVRLAEAA